MITQEYIYALLAKEYEQIDNMELKRLFFKRIIEPNKITLINLSSKEQEAFWLISDYMNDNDSRYRIVHSAHDIQDKFGLIMTLPSGDEIFVGFYGNLSKTLEQIPR